MNTQSFGGIGNVSSALQNAYIGNMYQQDQLSKIASENYKLNESRKKNTVIKKKKKHKKKEKQPEETKKRNNETNTDEIEEARRRKFEEVREKHRLEEQTRMHEIDRLRDAILLSEVIGQPRCKSRGSRRLGRG